MHKLFRGGVPYAVDVRKLQESWPNSKLAEGTVITHEEIETRLGLKYGMPRYYQVLNSWMRKLRTESGIFMVWQTGEGVKVLTPQEVLGHASKCIRSKVRQTGKAIRLLGFVDKPRLEPPDQLRMDHMDRVCSALAESLGVARKEMLVELIPVASLPKREIGAETAGQK